MSVADTARAPREGEALDLDKLRPFLAKTFEGESLDDLVVEQFPGGHSNLTYAVRFGDRDLVLRRPPFGSKVKRAHDMGRENRVLSVLSEHRAWAPKPAVFCDDHDVMGADFYLMQRIRGVILRRKIPSELSVDDVTAKRLSETLVDTLIELHALDYQKIGLGELGKPDGFVQRQVTGWTKRYHSAQTDEIEQMPRVSDWLESNMPVSPAPTVIHNDFKFDNLIYDVSLENVIGVLDWEMATVGDPLMDLGTMLCYWVEDSDADALKNLSFGPTTLPGMYTRRQLAERYAERTGRDISNVVFYFAFGLYKTAVVLQQIYYRFKQGLTKDDRFSGLIHGVRLLAETADATIERQSL
jgi:aminoglycoside phosphotransferase (APT) family kinase protein